MSRPRRPSVTIYDYPEDLNPFKDSTPATNQQHSYDTVELRHGKEPKNKFWTFGRSKKKRSNSFSVKSAWSGLFGKRKEPEPERRTTITTVSTSYQNGPSTRPIPPPRSSKDQQEFEEAFGTFTRRKKYTMDSSSTYGSNLTVNGDPARLYNGSPQDNTASILGELTPKPPARRFGQVSPRPRDEIPPLEYEAKEDNQSTRGDSDDHTISEEVPVPTRRLGRRSIPRVNVLEIAEEEDRTMTSDLSIRDENENLPDDYIFRRCSQDAVRRSNLSINSCVSTASGMSTLGRRKRRAPQPPQQRKEPTENSEETSDSANAQSSSIDLQITEDIDIAKVTEDIQEMTKKSENIDETINNPNSNRQEEVKEEEKEKEETDGEKPENEIDKEEEEEEKRNEKNENLEMSEKIIEVEKSEEKEEEKNLDQIKIVKEEEDLVEKDILEIEKVEINRIVEDKIEIFTDINNDNDSAAEESANDDNDDDDVEIRKKKSSGINRSDSFSVKEQIEQIERQIKELESKNLNNSHNNNNNINNNNGSTATLEEIKYYEPSETRLSIQANRRSFFKNMVTNGCGNNSNNSNNSNGVKIEIKELPREQRDIHVVKLTDSPIPIEASKEPVKIVALHISEPIKQIPEILDDVNVNPLPKPRRHSSTTNTTTTTAQSTLIISHNNDNNVSNNDFTKKHNNNHVKISRGDSL